MRWRADTVTALFETPADQGSGPHVLQLGQSSLLRQIVQKPGCFAQSALN